MDSRHRIEVFTEGCSSCEGAVAYAHELASSSADYEVQVWNVKRPEGVARMREVGLTDVPGLVVDGEPLGCCGRRQGEPVA